MKTKRVIKQAIALSIASLSNDIQETTDIEENEHRANAIKLLADAYRAICNS